MAEAIAKGAAPAQHSNIFVGNLDANTTEDNLKEAFGAYGEIESALLTNSAKSGRPSGFVKMKEVDAAARAVAGLNGNQGWEVKHANYDVGKAPKWNQKGGYGGYGYGYGYQQKGWGKGFSYGGWGGYGKGGGVPELREDGPEKPEPEKSDNLYVKHLPIGSTEDGLKETFSAHGEVAEVRILRPNFALECAALVRFATADGAEQARTKLDGTAPAGNTLPLFANTQTKSGASKKDHVYIKNIPTNTQEEKIKAIIAKNGEVKWSKIMRGGGGGRINATCAALFEMASEEEAELVIGALNEKELSLSEFCGPMKVRYAENKANKETAAEGETAAPPPMTRLAA